MVCTPGDVLLWADNAGLPSALKHRALPSARTLPKGSLSLPYYPLRRGLVVPPGNAVRTFVAPFVTSMLVCAQLQPCPRPLPDGDAVRPPTHPPTHRQSPLFATRGRGDDAAALPLFSAALSSQRASAPRRGRSASLALRPFLSDIVCLFDPVPRRPSARRARRPSPLWRRPQACPHSACHREDPRLPLFPNDLPPSAVHYLC